MEEVKSALLEWGVASATLPGQAESGDRHFVQMTPEGALVAVVDGLGHGAEAARAAEAAAAALRRHAKESVLSLVQRCHEALRGTRGVVMTLAFFHARDNTITAVGVGNVEGVMLRSNRHATPAIETLMLRGGVIGEKLPPLRAEVMAVEKGDMLILATDGVHNDFAQGAPRNQSPQEIADRILATRNKGTDDALVVVVRYLAGGR